MISWSIALVMDQKKSDSTMYEKCDVTYESYKILLKE